MPKKKHRSGAIASSYKKQHGLHHNKSRKYLKVYWPYLPVLVFVMIGISVSIFLVATRPDSASNKSSVSANSLLEQTNSQRQTNGLGSLALNTQLDSAAQAKANSMVSQDYWSHNTPSGKTPWQFIAQNGYSFSLAGENLAYGFSNSQSVLNAWMNSPSHRANILDSNYKNVGFGIATSQNYVGQGNETVIVAMYAAPNGSVLSGTTSNPQDQPFTNVSSIQPNSSSVGRIETFTTANATWSVFITGLIGGAALTLLVVRQGIFIKRWAVKSEQFVFEHPMLDIALVILVAGSALLHQTIGFIR